MNGCLPADCDIPKMKRNSYQVAIADGPLVPKHTSKVSEKNVGESELFVKRNYNNNVEDVFKATNSPTYDVTDSSANLTPNKKSNSKTVPFEKSPKYPKLNLSERPFKTKPSSHLLFLDREAFKRSKKGESSKKKLYFWYNLHLHRQKICLNFK